jgi:hypothetical protein
MSWFKDAFRAPYWFLPPALPLGLSLHLQFLNRQGRWGNWRHPETFNEHVQRQKLQPVRREFVELADKIRAKARIAEHLGDRWVTPTLWSGRSLPPLSERTWAPPFVIKASHSSGRNYFVRTAADIDWPAIEATCAGWLAARHLPIYGERHYDLIEPGLLVEPIVGANGSSPTDYKFFVIRGRVAAIQVDNDRFGVHRRSYYDRTWSKMPFSIDLPMEPGLRPRPLWFEEMVAAAEKLAAAYRFDFVRVDLYALEDHPRFGEATFFPDSGFGKFSPRAFDEMLGRLWNGEPPAHEETPLTVTAALSTS